MTRKNLNKLHSELRACEGLFLNAAEFDICTKADEALEWIREERYRQLKLTGSTVFIEMTSPMVDCLLRHQKFSLRGVDTELVDMPVCQN